MEIVFDLHRDLSDEFSQRLHRAWKRSASIGNEMPQSTRPSNQEANVALQRGTTRRQRHGLDQRIHPLIHTVYTFSTAVVSSLPAWLEGEHTPAKLRALRLPKHYIWAICSR